MFKKNSSLKCPLKPCHHKTFLSHTLIADLRFLFNESLARPAAYLHTLAAAYLTHPQSYVLYVLHMEKKANCRANKKFVLRSRLSSLALGISRAAFSVVHVDVLRQVALSDGEKKKVPTLTLKILH